MSGTNEIEKLFEGILIWERIELIGVKEIGES